MIKLSKAFQNGFVVEIEGEDIQSVMREFSESCVSEFLNEPKCGVCGNTNIVPNFRETGEGKNKYKYYEMKCTKPGCWATLSLGQKKDGTGLFPKRKDESGQLIPNNGWKKYVKEES